MIDSRGYRANVGIILCNDSGGLFWARRVGQQAWQFPQGGIQEQENAEQALFRELHEEVGLAPEHVEVMGATRDWLYYRLPKHLIRRHSKPLCIGQKQRWFLLRLVGSEDNVCLDRCEKPEFDHWRWVSYWHPLEEIVFFKRKVYERALTELAPLVLPEDAPQRPPRRRARQSGR